MLNGHAHTYERLKPYDGDGNVAANESKSVYEKEEKTFVSVTIGAGGKINKRWKPDTSDELNCADGNIVAHSEHVGSFSVIEIEGKRLKLQGINSFTGEVFDTFEIVK